MADVKFSALPAASTLDGTEIAAVAQGGVSKRTTIGAIRAGRTTFSNADYTILATDRYVSTTTTVFTASRTVTLPAANALNAGALLYIGDDGGAITTAFTLSIARAGSDTIHGGTASIVLSSARAVIILESDGVSNWTTVSRSPAVRVQTFTSGTTFTPTIGVKAMYVECFGGGGAGGGAATSSSQVSVGSGGGAGAYSAVYLTGTLKSSYAYVIGAGGTGVSGTTGNAGTDTTFDSPSVCTAKGGGGGTTMAAGTGATDTGGSGLGGAGGSGVGDLKLGGGYGSYGFRFSATTGMGGQGAASMFGMGGTGRFVAGGAAGGGSGAIGTGGGGAGTGSTAAAGGGGVAGLIRVTEFF
jgi:hypothetical protein